MSRTGNANSPAYDAAADLAHVEREMITVMYVLGMETDNISTDTFDEIVAELKSTFPFIRLKGTDGNFNRSASNDALKEINVLLMINLRRIWHRWQLAGSFANG